jgi:site-specific recombinase XerD
MKYTNAIVWDHRGRVPKGGKGQVEIRITYNRKSYHFGTGIKVHKSELVAGQIINCPGADELNKRVSLIYTKVLACVNKAIESDEEINTEYIRKQVWKMVESNSDEPTLLNWIEDQIPKLNIKEGTKKHYNTLLTRLKEYNQLRRWQDVTIEGIVNFDAWLHSLTEKENEMGAKALGRLNKGLSEQTIYNYHKNLKALLRRAFLFNKIELNPYEKLKGHFNRGDVESVEYLTIEEMQSIMNLKLAGDSTLSRSRDLFVFQMWTGLAYSDAQSFDISQYKKVNGKWVNIGERIKTGVPYVSVLLPPVVDVLEKYGWKTPQIENHVYNRMLKAIGEMAKIGTKLHSHLARHSFATYMLSQGTRIENVGKMLGQKNIRTTQRYAKVLAQDVRNDFDKIAAQMTQSSEQKKKRKKKK